MRRESALMPARRVDLQMEPPMPAYARRDIVDEDRVGVYHCVARVFEERSFAVPTRTRGGILATGRLGFSIGFASLRVFSALRFARL